MRFIDLAFKDLTQLVRDWKAGLFLVVMPIAVTLIMGLAFGGSGGGQDPRLPVGVLDQDGSSLSGSLLEMLQQSDVIRLVASEGADAGDLENQVGKKKLAAAVIIPAGYGASALTSPVPLILIADESAAAGATARSEIQTAVVRLLGAVEAAQLSVQAYTAQASFPDDAARQAFFDAALVDALAAWQAPQLTVTSTSGAPAKEPGTSSAGGMTHISPAIMVQFAMAGLIGSAEIVVLERRSRALRRMLTTAISRAEIILGHCLAMFVTILLQFVILIAFGQLVLGVDYLRAPLATLLMMATTALWAASLGMLIGALAKTDEQVVIFSLIPMFVLSGMGGAWVPLEVTGKTFQTIGHLLPTAWAIDGFENIVIRGLGLGSVLLPAGILLAYAALFFALAVWRFRFE